MGKVFEAIDESHAAFIASQRLFFVATAPREGGHINLSPKGLDSLRVLGPHRVAYADFTGSGVETIAHLRDDGRIVLMFCAFEGSPKILRLYGTGRVIEPHHESFEKLLERFPKTIPVRSIIVVEVDRVADACGFGVPLYEYRGERRQLGDWADRKGAEALDVYRHDKNAESIDGLPGLTFGAAGLETALDALLPSPVVCAIERTVSVDPDDVFPAERDLLSERAVLKRRRELAAGRKAARRALAAAGLDEPVAIGRGDRGEPLWPGGYVGSISHGGGVAIAVVAKATACSAIGLDVEDRDRPVDPGVADHVCVPSELQWVAPRTRDWLRRFKLLFSAKETIFKALYPVGGVELTFPDATLEYDEGRGLFSAVVTRDASPNHPAGTRFEVQATEVDGLVVTALVLPA